MAHSMKRFQGICDSSEGRERKKKKPVYMLQLTPTPTPPPYHSGDVKTPSGGKVGGGGEKERKADGLAVLGYSLPPSGMFARLKRHFRHAYPLPPPTSTTNSLSLSLSGMHIFPFNPSSLL